MSGLLELQMLAAVRPALDEPIEVFIAWYRAKGRALFVEAIVQEHLGRADHGAQLRAMARLAHEHADQLAVEAASGHAIPAARTPQNEVI